MASTQSLVVPRALRARLQRPHLFEALCPRSSDIRRHRLPGLSASAWTFGFDPSQVASDGRSWRSSCRSCSSASPGARPSVRKASWISSGPVVGLTAIDGDRAKPRSTSRVPRPSASRRNPVLAAKSTCRSTVPVFVTDPRSRARSASRLQLLVGAVEQPLLRPIECLLRDGRTYCPAGSRPPPAGRRGHFELAIPTASIASGQPCPPYGVGPGRRGKNPEQCVEQFPAEFEAAGAHRTRPATADRPAPARRSTAGAPSRPA